ncbi:hypothetical protein [Pararhizobium arenae]|jgi:hypothetical protein|uniref:hypothetical protein n=1 Tax=Pararhizobium arenae TaxID=1856850 RepID=UPI000ACD91FC|nr:hypothetical protein [Pararhizobium arenae]
MQQNVARHPLFLPAIGGALALAMIGLVALGFIGWVNHGAEMVRSLSAAGLSWCM